VLKVAAQFLSVRNQAGRPTKSREMSLTVPICKEGRARLTAPVPQHANDRFQPVCRDKDRLLDVLMPMECASLASNHVCIKILYGPNSVL